MNVCDYCSVKTALYKCNNCKNAKYCSEECQRSDWENLHSETCMIGKKLDITPTKINGDKEVIGKGTVVKGDDIDIEIGDNLGAGDLGEVYKAIDKKSKQEIVIKVFYGGNFFILPFVQEFVIHETLNEIKDFCTLGIAVCAVRALRIKTKVMNFLTKKIEEADRFAIIFPFKNTAETLSRSETRIQAIEKSKIPLHAHNARQARRIVSYKLMDLVGKLHKFGVYHLDLKSDNVLVSGVEQVGGTDEIKPDDISVTLIDFGGSCAPKSFTPEKQKRIDEITNQLKLPKDETRVLKSSVSLCTGGGGVLVDPRIRDDEQDLDFKGKQTDIYAMALALLFFAAGASPFEFRSNEKLVSGGFIQAPLKGRGDEELQKVLIEIQKTEPKKRKNAEFYAQQLKKLMNSK